MLIPLNKSMPSLGQWCRLRSTWTVVLRFLNSAWITKSAKDNNLTRRHNEIPCVCTERSGKKYVHRKHRPKATGSIKQVIHGYMQFKYTDIPHFVDFECNPDSKVHGANMRTNWGRQDPVENGLGSAYLRKYLCDMYFLASHPPII